MGNSRLVATMAVVFAIILVVVLGAAILPSLSHTIFRPTPTVPGTAVPTPVPPTPVPVTFVEGVGRIVTTLPIDTTPWGMVSSANALWVWNDNAGRVSRYDLSSNQLITEIKIGDPKQSYSGLPGQIVSDGKSIWTGDEHAVSRIEPETNTIVDKIPLDNTQFPGVNHRISVTALALDGQTLWVSDFQNNIVLRVDLQTKKVIAVVTGLRSPGGIAVTPGAVWVAQVRSNSIVRIDPATNSVAATVQFPGFNSLFTVKADGKTLWVPLGQGQALARVDANTNEIIAIIPFEHNVHGITLTDDAAWIVTSESFLQAACLHLPAEVVRIDRNTNSVVGSIPVQCAGGLTTVNGDVWVGVFPMSPNMLVQIHPEP